MRFKSAYINVAGLLAAITSPSITKRTTPEDMAFKIRVFTTVAIFVLVARMLMDEANAQVTFSRDWNPGKRAENPEFHNALKTASAVCHLLINQVRQLANCENRDEMDPGTTIFSGGR